MKTRQDKISVHFHAVVSRYGGVPFQVTGG